MSDAPAHGDSADPGDVPTAEQVAPGADVSVRCAETDFDLLSGRSLAERLRMVEDACSSSSDEDEDEGVGEIELTGDFSKDRATLAALLSSIKDEDGAAAGAGPGVGDEDEDDDAAAEAKGRAPRTKHEVDPWELPVTHYSEIELPVHSELRVAGHVTSRMDKVVLVAAPFNSPALLLGTVLALGDRRPIGVVDDVFGPVQSPMYAVRFNSVEDIDALELEPGETSGSGTAVFFGTDGPRMPFVEPEKIYTKGSDASNMDDEEPGEDEMEFSDDEEERMFKQSKKKGRGRNKKRAGGRGSDRGSGRGAGRGSGRGRSQGEGRGAGAALPMQQQGQYLQQQQQPYFSHPLSSGAYAPPPPVGPYFAPQYAYPQGPPAYRLNRPLPQQQPQQQSQYPQHPYHPYQQQQEQQQQFGYQQLQQYPPYQQLPPPPPPPPRHN